jgi:hypothetical protein
MQPESAYIQAAVASWKNEWRIATFGSDVEYDQNKSQSDGTVSNVLQDFGSKLIELGELIWMIQSDMPPCVAENPVCKRVEKWEGLTRARISVIHRPAAVLYAVVVLENLLEYIMRRQASLFSQLLSAEGIMRHSL